MRFIHRTSSFHNSYTNIMTPFGYHSQQRVDQGILMFSIEYIPDIELINH